MSTGRREIAIPFDPEAEDSVIGIIVASAQGAAAASEVIIPEDFYRPEWCRTMAVALQVPLLAGEERRIGSIASLASVGHDLLERIVVNRPWPEDPGGMLAQKVKMTSRRRRVMALAAQIYNGGAEERQEELADLARELIGELSLISATPAPSTDGKAGPLRTIGYIRRHREQSQA